MSNSFGATEQFNNALPSLLVVHPAGDSTLTAMSEAAVISPTLPPVPAGGGDGALLTLVADSALVADSPLDPSGVRAKANAFAIRAFDVTVSLVLLTTLAPLILVAIAVVRLDSPGPAFYRAERVGYRGRRLRMLKFRKMRNDATGLALTMDDDHRFTRVGSLLAKLKIDEIPQLFQVLVGQMSLVGPRPEDTSFVELHRQDYHYVLSVRPGVTGLSQIAFAEESRILDDDDPLNHYLDRILPQKIALDKMYAVERTFWFNMRILFWTTAAVIMRRQVAVHRETGQMNLRRR